MPSHNARARARCRRFAMRSRLFAVVVFAAAVVTVSACSDNTITDRDGASPGDASNDISADGAPLPSDVVDDGAPADACVDNDMDGVFAPPCGADCDDNNARRRPGVREVCDMGGVDEDCDPC